MSTRHPRPWPSSMFLPVIIIHYHYVCPSGFTAVASFELICVSKFLNYTVPVAVFTISTPWIGAQNTVKGATGSHSAQSWLDTHVWITQAIRFQWKIHSQLRTTKEP